MQLTSLTLLLSLAVSSIASSQHELRSKRSHQIKARSSTAARRANGWNLVDDFKGQSLINAFTFSEGAAENGGVAQWTSLSDAWKDGLIAVGKDESVHIRVDDTKYSSSRKAIKMIANKGYNNFLMAVDVAWQPQVCGVWPAIWTTSTTTSWPDGGEIDLVEYVNQMKTGSFSIHTGDGCTMPSPTTGLFTGVQMLAGSAGLDCNPLSTNAQGCGMRSTQSDSTGMGANKAGGGTYVLRQDSTGVHMWFFKKGRVPKDLTSGSPNPDSWTTPDFSSPSSSCSPSHFAPQNLIINTNLGGTWAEGSWADPSAYAGQTGGSCQSMTGYNTAAEYIANEGQDFKHAYWKIRSIQVYQ